MINLRFNSGVSPYNKYDTGSQKQQTGGFCRKKILSADTLSFSSAFLNRQVSIKYKNQGDEYARNNENEKAIFYYKKAVSITPELIQPYYNLAKIYKEKGQLNQVIKTYQELLGIRPEEIEAQTLLGDIYLEQEKYGAALTAYKKAIEIDPKYDLANRSLKKLENLILAGENPIKADSIKRQVAQNNLKKSLSLVNEHAAPEISGALRDIDITFDKTDSLSGYQNIAQYENHNNRIVITSDYIWAAPEIVAAYVIHEAVHAKDKDGLSSIREEQDAYHSSIEFWIAHNNGVKDPELDYAAGLYRENPDKLNKKVAQTYRSRDKSIPEYSPNHIPPDQEGFFSRLKIYFFGLKSQVSNNSVPIN